MTITLEPATAVSAKGSTKSAKMPATTDPDRRAAEYVLSIGGGVTIKEKYEERDVTKVGDLPPTPFVITRVHLAWNETATDSGLASFQGCKNLTHVDFGVAKNVGDVGLAYLRDCKDIIHLGVNSTKVTDEGLAIFKHCKKLESLELHGCKVGDEGLAQLKDLKSLRHLVLDVCPINGTGFAVTNNEPDQPQAFTSLTDLSLARTQMNDANLAHLKNAKGLRRLILDGCTIRGTGLTHLKELPELTELSLACPTLTDVFANRLTELKPLQKLSLSGSGLTDEGLQPLHRLANLRELDLTGTKVIAAGTAKLQAALPKCKITGGE